MIGRYILLQEDVRRDSGKQSCRAKPAAHDRRTFRHNFQFTNALPGTFLGNQRHVMTTPGCRTQHQSTTHIHENHLPSSIKTASDEKNRSFCLLPRPRHDTYIWFHGHRSPKDCPYRKFFFLSFAKAPQHVVLTNWLKRVGHYLKRCENVC